MPTETNGHNGIDDGVSPMDFFADPVAAAKAAMANGSGSDLVSGSDEMYSESNGIPPNGGDEPEVSEEGDDAPQTEEGDENDDDVEGDEEGTNDDVGLTSNNDDYDDDENTNELVTNIKVEENEYDVDDEGNYAEDTDGAFGASEATVINGRGIWHSWTRNFATPLLALLDLLDNAFDATSLVQAGRIYVAPDMYVQQGRGGKPQTTGLTLWNSSVTPIKPLNKVLEVYTSLKGSNASSIGENGVGLKQGCATLSNLSFCIVKSNGNQYSMGVLAYELQTDQGCSLPSFTFESDNMEDLRNEMITKFTLEFPAVGECITKYGSVGGQPSDDPSLKSMRLRLGVDRIIEKFQYLNQGGWDEFPHAFGLIVDHLKHGEKASATTGGKSHTLDQQIRVNKILETLYADLPKRYLHIPTSLLDVRVGGQIVNFNFWQPRLVEMAQFDLQIHRTANIIDVFNARKDKQQPPGEDGNDGEDGSKKKVVYIPPDDDYTLRVYTGFDALRVCDDRAQKTAAMYIYSRQSGRLIKANMDCRGELGLTSGGTDYCQGLTLIVDDFNANFPLNPTKQDVAFGEQSNGETHKRNLYVWLNAAIRLYYMFYKDRVCNKQKRILTESLRLIEPKVRQLIAQSSTSFQSLSACQFTTFGEYASTHLMNNGQSIRLLPFRTIEYFLGRDSRLQLPPVPENEIEFEKPSTKKRKKSTPSRAAAEASRHFLSSLAAEEDDDEDNFDMNEMDDDDLLAYNNYKYASKNEKARRRSGKGNGEMEPIDSAYGKRARRSNISESKYSEPHEVRSGGNNVHDMSFMSTRISALEDENRQLKKEIHQNVTMHGAIVAKKTNQVEALKASKNQLLLDLTKCKQLIKQLKHQGKGKHAVPFEDLSVSRVSGGSAGMDAKNTKRLKNLKSSIDLLRSENEDLKSQIEGLESTIQRKDKTIQAQRKLIDQRNQEDEDEPEVEEDSDDDLDSDLVDDDMESV